MTSRSPDRRSARESSSPASTSSGPGPSSCSQAPVAAVSACSPASGFRSTWARTTGSGRTPELRPAARRCASPIVPCSVWTQTGAPDLADEQPRRPRTPSASNGADRVVARADLDDPAALEVGHEAGGERLLGLARAAGRRARSARHGAAPSPRRRGGRSPRRPRAGRRGRGRARSASSRRARVRRRPASAVASSIAFVDVRRTRRRAEPA